MSLKLHTYKMKFVKMSKAGRLFMSRGPQMLNKRLVRSQQYDKFCNTILPSLKI